MHTKPLTKVEIYCSLACKFNALLFDRKAASNRDPLSFLCYHSMKLKSRHSELPILTFYQFPSNLVMASNLIPYIWCVLTLYGKALEIELQLGTFDFTAGWVRRPIKCHLRSVVIKHIKSNCFMREKHTESEDFIITFLLKIIFWWKLYF